MIKIRKQAVVLVFAIVFVLTFCGTVTAEDPSSSVAFNISNATLNTQNSNPNFADTNFSDQNLDEPSSAENNVQSLISPDPKVIRGGTVVYSTITIQDAVDHAIDGDTIEVEAGTYIENVLINKKLYLLAKGQVTVKPKDNKLPAFQIGSSVGNPGGDGSTIRGFNVDGGGNQGPYAAILLIAPNCVIVSNTVFNSFIGIEIRDAEVYLNNITNCGVGIISIGKSNVFLNIIQNNQAGIESYGGSFTGNTITHNAYNGISSLGPVDIIKNNSITNNGEAGIEISATSAGNDNRIISGNKIDSNKEGIYIKGISNCVIDGNTISNNSLNGIVLQKGFEAPGISGIMIPSDNNQITGNTIENNGNNGIFVGGSSGNHIARNSIKNNGKDGIFLTDDIYTDKIFNCANNTILSNDISNNGNGISFGFIFGSNYGNHANFNRIVNNTYWGLVNYSGESIDAIYNWWGSNSSPSGKIYGSHVKYDPWLVLKAYASPASTYPGGFSTITADLNHGSDGSIAQNNLPDGIKVLFATDKGTIASPKVTEYGLTKSVLSIPTYIIGTANVSVMVDAQTVNVPVPIQSLEPVKIKIQNLKKWKVHYLYYVKIIKPNGQITTKIFRGDIKDYRSAYINLGKLPHGSKMQITSYITNKSHFKRTVSLVNTIITPKQKWKYQWIYKKNVRASPGRIWKNPVIRIMTIRI